MSAWDKTVGVYVDVERPMEPFVQQDAGGVWRRVSFPVQVQGAKYPISFNFVKPTSSGGYEDALPDEGDVLYMEARGKSKSGTSLFGIETFNEESGVYTGLFDLATEQLKAAMSDYPRLMTVVDLVLSAATGEIRHMWQFVVVIERQVFCGDPTSWTPETAYYTAEQADALFARRDGPAGYGVKLVTYNGLNYWAQKVGVKWVIPLVVEIGGAYYQQLVEVPDEE